MENVLEPEREGVMNLPTNCPRCGQPDCRDPDSKACSDNCIMHDRREIERLKRELAAARERCEGWERAAATWKADAERRLQRAATAEAALAGLREDAQRYRWLRDTADRDDEGHPYIALNDWIDSDDDDDFDGITTQWLQGETADAAIDTAMQPSVQGGDSVHSANARTKDEWSALLENLPSALSERPDLTPGDRGTKWDRRERRNPADNVSIHGMYDMHLFHPIEGATVDEVIANWRQHNSVLQPATVGDRPVDDMGASMLCPAIVLHGNKELRRVGEMVFPYHKGVREACDETKLRAWRDALLADPDIPRLLRERAALSEREPNAKQE